MTEAEGAKTRDRTGDLILTMDVLYRLSYLGTIENGSNLSEIRAVLQNWTGYL
jgi:hypothetical protein